MAVALKPLKNHLGPEQIPQRLATFGTRLGTNEPGIMGHHVPLTVYITLPVAIRKKICPWRLSGFQRSIPPGCVPATS